MKLYNKNYFTAGNINNKQILYGFFSKKGGCSSGNYYSLNCGLNTDDSKELVEQNIQIAKKNLGLKNQIIKFLNQTHSGRVEIIDKKNLNLTINADGSITKDKSIALSILTADCAPIFIFDRDNTFICSLHAGWKGCLNNIIQNALKKINQLNIESHKLIAIVGPCLGKKNFEIDENIKDIFINQNFQYEKFFLKNPEKNKNYFDMRGLINFQLQSHSVNKIFNVTFDTYFNKDLFFSHRKSTHNDSLPTGRMINIISFQDAH